MTQFLSTPPRRYIVLPNPAMLDDPAVTALVSEAVARARVLFDPKGEHRLIIKSASAKQRPRRPSETATARRKAGKKTFA